MLSYSQIDDGFVGGLLTPVYSAFDQNPMTFDCVVLLIYQTYSSSTEECRKLGILSVLHHCDICLVQESVTVKTFTVGHESDSQKLLNRS